MSIYLTIKKLQLQTSLHCRIYKINIILLHSVDQIKTVELTIWIIKYYDIPVKSMLSNLIGSGENHKLHCCRRQMERDFQCNVKQHRTITKTEASKIADCLLLASKWCVSLVTVGPRDITKWDKYPTGRAQETAASSRVSSDGKINSCQDK